MVGQSDPRADDERNLPLSRRKLLALTTGTVAGFAGCGGQDSPNTQSPNNSGDGSSDGSTSTPGETDTPGESATPAGGGEPIDGTMNSVWSTGFNPNDWNANPYAENDIGWPWQWPWNIVAGSGAQATAVNGTTPLIALESSELNDEGCVQEWTIQEGHHWWDGTPVTNEDYRTQHLIEMFQVHGPNAREKSSEPRLELEGDRVIRFHLNSPVNPQLAEHRHFTESHFDLKADYWTEYLERYEDATTEDETNSITQEIRELNITMEEFRDEGLGNGMWKPDEWSDTEITLDKHEGHVRSDWTNLQHWNWTFMPDQQTLQQAYRNNQFDMIFHETGNVRDIIDSLDNFNVIRNFPYLYYENLSFNFRNKHMARRGVRRAIAHLLDYEQFVQVYRSIRGAEVIPPYRQTGLAKGIGEAWLGNDWQDKLIDYGATAQQDKAEQALQNAGYSKEGDTWVGPDGDTLGGLRLFSPSSEWARPVGEYVTSALNEFGIETESLFKSGGQFADSWENKFDFDMAVWYGGGPHPATSPYAGFVGSVVEYVNSSTDVAKDAEPTESCTLEEVAMPELTSETTPRYARPVRPEFPSEVGQKGTDGEMETLYPIKWKREMNQAQDRETIQELSRKLSWYVNWQLPQIEIFTESWSHSGDTENFYWGDGSEDEHWIRTEAWLMRGWIQGRSEPHSGTPEGPMQP